MNRIIYVIGDSHQQSFDKRWYHDPVTFEMKTMEPQYGPDDIVFKVIPYGSSPAFVIDDATMRVCLSQVDKCREVWFVFGEIDCRFQIFNHHKTMGISLDESIGNTVKKYLDYVQKLIAEDYKIAVVSADPAIREDLVDHASTLIRENDAQTHDRVYITEVFNSKLKLECAYRNIKFIDIYYWLVDPKDGQSRRDLLQLHYIPEKAKAGILEGMHYKYLGDLVIEKLNLKGEQR